MHETNLSTANIDKDSLVVYVSLPLPAVSVTYLILCTCSVFFSDQLESETSMLV